MRCSAGTGSLGLTKCFLRVVFGLNLTLMSTYSSILLIGSDRPHTYPGNVTVAFGSLLGSSCFEIFFFPCCLRMKPWGYPLIFSFLERCDSSSIRCNIVDMSELARENTVVTTDLLCSSGWWEENPSNDLCELASCRPTCVWIHLVGGAAWHPRTEVSCLLSSPTWIGCVCSLHSSDHGTVWPCERGSLYTYRWRSVSKHVGLE